MSMSSSSLKPQQIYGCVWSTSAALLVGISPVTTAGVLVLLSAFKGWPPAAWSALL